MMLEVFGFNAFFTLAIATAISGTLIAGLWDLLTTEIPDEIPYFMASFGIFLWFIYMLTTGSTLEFLSSVFIGSIFLIYGYVLYKTGHWGGGDGALLASLGFLLPILKTIEFFPLHLFINLYLFGAAWIVIYSLVAGLANSKFRKIIKKEMLKDQMTRTYFLFFIVFLFLSVIDKNMLFASLLFALLIFYYYGKLIEKYVFRKRIPSSQLKVGDVLADSKLWVGIGEDEVKEIKEKKKFVEIKEGVRFGLAFFLALIFTLIFGGSPIVNFYLSILF
ncbi:MAG: prepilin peptidase [Candidatus Aenigmatarchaeota archaeon]